MRKTLSRFGLVALALAGCEQKSAPSGELTRSQCVTMVIKIDQLKNKELGRANSVDQRLEVDRCMERGTRAQYECVQFATTASEVGRCDEQAR